MENKKRRISNKRLTLFLLALLPTIGNAYEAPEEIKQLTINEIDSIQNAMTELPIDNKPIIKSKSDLEKLFGTWFVSYSLGNGTHTDKIELNSIFELSDGDLAAEGRIFLDNTGEGEYFICSNLPSDLASFHSADYQCNGVIASVPNIYVFKYSGDTITNGYFGTGETVREIANQVSDHSIPLSGYRENNNLDSYYDDVTGEVVIPNLIYKGAKYKVIFEDTGNFLFSVKEAKPL